MRDEIFDLSDHGLQIAYSVAGDAPRLLVFIHGLGCSRKGFDAAFEVARLRDNFRIVTLDLPGFGESSKPRDFSYKLEDQAEVVTRLVRRLGRHDVFVVGHSMGGDVGALVAARLRAVLLVNCEGNFVPEDPGPSSQEIADQTEADFVARGFEEFVRQLETSGDASLNQWAAWCRQSSPVAFHRSVKSMVHWARNGELFGVYDLMPNKAYVHGEHGMVSPAMATLDRSQVFSVPRSGHFMMLDNPECFYDVIAQAATSVVLDG